MNYQKKFWVSIYNSFRDRGGGLPSPPQSIKVQIGARSLRVKGDPKVRNWIFPLIQIAENQGKKKFRHTNQ